MRVRLLVTAAVPVLALAACGGTDPDFALERYDSCEALEQAIVDQAESEIAWRYNWQFPWQGGENTIGVPPVLGAPSMEDGASQGGTALSGRSYSDTNVQVEGLDEPDLVETDGDLILTLAADHLVVSRAWPASQLAELARLQLEGTPHGMMYRKDAAQVVVLSQIWWNSVQPLSGDTSRRLRADQPVAKLTVVDLTDPASPQVVREAYVQGQIRDARLLQDRLYLATYTTLTPASVTQADDKAQAQAALAEADLDTWMPWRLDVRRTQDGWSADESQACGCADVYGSERRSGNFMTTVSALDLTDLSAPVQGTGVIGSLAAVYANATSLYVAGVEESDGPFRSMDSAIETIVHRFDITGAPAQPAYRASGKVLGTVLNQFSMDEKDGRLRIATTDPRATTSGVYVLEQQGVELGIVGRVEGLAPGEQIFAVRYIDDVAYVVTFEVWQGDPLFTIDLTDPTAPVVRGALEIPGFSNYLHPFGEGRLLSVGQAGNWGGGVHVSIFDVSNLDDPLLEQRFILEDAGWSEAQNDHHAFNYFPEQQVLVLPADAPEGSRMFVLNAVPGEPLTEIGRLSQDDVLSGTEADPWCTAFRRSVIIENVLYAVSNAGLTVSGVQTPDQVLASLPFTGIDSCADRSWGW